MATWLLVITTIMRLLPMITEMVRDGRIKDATTKEVLATFENEFNKRWQARIDAAVVAGTAAGNGVQSDVTSGGNTDPFDRASTRKSDGK